MEGSKDINNALGDIMTVGPTATRDAAQNLLREKGGVGALDKLMLRKNSIADARIQIVAAEVKIEEQFDKVTEEAKQGFNIVTWMDQSIFMVGIFLIVLSAVFILLSEKSPNSWVYSAVTGVPGILITLVERFYDKPRENTQKAVKDLMKMYVLFLGYLRRLYQIDHTYARHIIEDDVLDPETMKTLSNLTQDVIDDAIKELLKDGNEPPAGTKT
jgi:hypothetical protein